jgi:acyl dehydratase
MEIKPDEVIAGLELPTAQHTITQDKINMYARASGDYNPIHVNEDFASKTLLGGTIAHGMLVLAYISGMMTTAFGQSWLNRGRLSVRFREPVRPGDVVIASGKIVKIENGEAGRLVICEVLCANQKGETVINGEARVNFP